MLEENELRRVLSAAYDKLYKEGEEIFRKYDPCRVHLSKLGNTCACHPDDPERSFCCRDCCHLTPNGCSIRSLSCKLWSCWECRKEGGDEFVEKLESLRVRASTFHLGIRDSKEEIIERTVKSYYYEMRRWESIIKEGQECLIDTDISKEPA